MFFTDSSLFPKQVISAKQVIKAQNIKRFLMFESGDTQVFDCECVENIIIYLYIIIIYSKHLKLIMLTSRPFEAIRLGIKT